MDPYKVLGVPYDATEDEIKKAYRALSRKYHPDANVGKPNQKELEEKFKEVQQAYSAIMDQKLGKAAPQQGYRAQGSEADFGGFGGFGDFWGFGGSGGFESDQGFGGSQGPQSKQAQSKDEQYMRAAANYIKNGYYREGLNVLEQVQDRRGPWYYYSALANYCLGNNAIALEHARTACEFEQDNPYYRSLLTRLTGGESRYQSRSASYGGNPSMQGTNYCMQACVTATCISMCCSGGHMGLPIICCI